MHRHLQVLAAMLPCTCLQLCCWQCQQQYYQQVAPFLHLWCIYCSFAAGARTMVHSTWAKHYVPAGAQHQQSYVPAAALDLWSIGPAAVALLLLQYHLLALCQHHLAVAMGLRPLHKQWCCRSKQVPATFRWQCYVPAPCARCLAPATRAVALQQLQNLLVLHSLQQLRCCWGPQGIGQRPMSSG